MAGMGKIKKVVLLLPLVIGLFVLFGWISERLILTKFLVFSNSMAPLTAVLFIAVCIGELLNDSKKLNIRLKHVINLFVILINLFVFFNITFNFNVEFEDYIFTHLNFPQSSTYQVSPLTALLFVLYSLSSEFDNYKFKRTASTIHSIGLFVTSVFVLGYMLGEPFMYSRSYNPIAFLTSISLFVIFFVKIDSSSKEYFPYSLFYDSAIGSKLIKSFFPLILGVIIAFNWINKIDYSIAGEKSFLPAIVIIISLGFVFYLSLIVSRTTAKEITKYIDAKEKSERERIGSEEKFQVLFEKNSVGLIVTDYVANIKMVNSTCCELLGKTEEDLINKNLEMFLQPNQKSELIKYYKKIIGNEDNLLSQFEFPFYNSQHELKYGIINVGVLKKQALVIVSITDITELKRIEKEIYKNNQRLESLLKIAQLEVENADELYTESLDAAIKLTDSKIGYIYYYDEKTELFTLNTWSESVMDVCTIAEKQRVYELNKTGIWGEAVRQRRPIMVNDFTAANPLKKGYPEGHAELFKFLTVPIIYGGKIIAVVGVANKEEDYNDGDIKHLTLLMDVVVQISEKKNAEIKLKETSTKLTELNKTKDQFISVLAHDLRAPFNGLLGLSKILVDDIQNLEPEEIADYANSLHVALNKQYELLNSLLEWAKIKNDKTTLQYGKYNAREIVVKNLSQYEINGKNKNITLVNNVNPDIYILADPNMCDLVFRNLVSNSIKFTKNSGKIIVNAEVNENRIKFSISDNGVGIEDKIKEKLLNSSERISTEGTNKEKGTGLGISLCKEIIEKHGGSITIESEVGVGTTFYFDFENANGK